MIKEIKESKSKYFSDLALSHLNEIRLSVKGGKLSERDGWRNVVEHQLVQLAAAEALCKILNLPLSARKKMEKVAATHDWRMRLDKRPEDFDELDLLWGEELQARVNPDLDLLFATGPEFLVRVVNGKATFLELLQFYLDDICKGSEIVSFDERVSEVEARRQDLNSDPALTARLGGRKYWDVERETGHKVENTIFPILRKRGHLLRKPSDIPLLIKNQIEEKYKA